MAGLVDIEVFKVGDDRIQIQFAPGSGKFLAKFDERDFAAATIEELREKMKRAAKKAAKRKPVEVTLLGARIGKDTNRSWGVEGLQTGEKERGNSLDAIYRGQNQRTNEHLITVNDQKEKLRIWNSSDTKIVRRLTAAEHAEYRALVETLKAAEKDVEDFIENKGIDLDKLFGKGEE